MVGIEHAARRIRAGWCRFWLMRRCIWCIRVSVSRAPWSQGSYDLEAASGDLEPRPVDRGGLSIYAAATEGEARKVTALHVVMNSKPKATHYLFIPTACIAIPGLYILRESDKRQHPDLRRRHYNLYGLDDTSRRIKLVAAIMAHPQMKLMTFSKGDLKHAAAPLVASERDRSYMRYPGAWA